MNALPPILTLSDKARRRLAELHADAHEGRFLRLSVGSKGCSGHSYEMNFVEAGEPTDEKIVDGDLTLFIDRKAVLFLIGTEMDYKESALESGFVFSNPNEKARCGCGESFFI